MNSNYKPLQILATNKTTVFHSPLTNTDETLVRTGTIPDGSCGLHSILHAYSDEYVDKSIEDRRSFVKELRETLAKNLDIKEWELFDNGIVSLISFQEILHKILTNYHNVIKKIENYQSVSGVFSELFNIELTAELFNNCKSLMELIPFNHLEKIDSDPYKNCNYIDECKTSLVNKSINYLNNLEEFKNLCVNNNELKNEYQVMLKKILEGCIEKARSIAFKKFKLELENPTSFIDMWLIGFLSDFFERDLYFIDGKTRLPYQIAYDKNWIKNRKSIVIIWISDAHYEIVGRLLPKNKIQREFDSTDPLICKIKSLLFSREEIETKYPELKQYIPNFYKK